uniref:Ig-like domain-containing protein n=1 Tax=Esox lucius TaxID=8010 RepID=A0A3P8XJ06_ESOLU
ASFVKIKCIINCFFSPGLKVIGGKRTVILAKDADLFCRLSEAEEFDQITWQKETRENPNKHNFLVIKPDGTTSNVNGLKGRVLFIGNTSDYLGSIRIRNVTLLDEGTYTCIFSVSSGPIQTEMSLTVIVPPVMSVTGHVSPVVDNEVVLVTCIAAAAKPKAEVFWNTGALNKSLRWVTNSTQHANGTSTVLSQLIGLPTRTANQKQVQCVVNQSALEEERTLSYTIDIHYPPQTVNIKPSSQDKYFLCVADGNPKPNYIWSRYAPLYGDTLHLLSLSADLNGLYVCEASNLYGSTNGSLYIHTTSVSSRICLLSQWVV